MSDARGHISLRELQQLVRQTLEGRFALPVWVSAEISELKVNASGHCYIDLVEKGGDNGVPTAQARAVIWRSHYPRIAAYFEAQTGERLTAGIRILAKVLVSYHELYGFSLQITDIDPAYTLGDMEQQRQQTIARLQQEGIWEMNRQATLPPAIQRVAVVTSAQAAGFQDFHKELSRSPYRIEITLFEAFMQGAAAEDSITSALCDVAIRQAEFDAVILIRGGGSRSDLNCFNTYRLCNHIAQFPLPVITGIGHDKDVSVADMVAHTTLKTPTAVAGWLVERMSQLDGWLDFAAVQLQNGVLGRTKAWALQLERFSEQLRLTALSGIKEQRTELQRAEEALPTTIATFIQRQRLRLNTHNELIQSRSPQQILRMGFAVVRAGGQAVRSTHDIQAGQRLTVEVADGEFDTIVK